MSLQPVQIFMSYAWKDNTLPPDDPLAKKGFVTALWEQLNFELGELAADDPKPVLWHDRNKIDRAQQHDPMIEQTIAESSLFLVVLSNNWLASEYCRKELRLFRERWSHESEFDFGHRIILAHKTSVPRARRAELFPNQLGYEFFKLSDHDGIEIPFWHRGRGETEFYNQAVELGRVVAKRANAVINIPPPAPIKLPPDSPVVYLAKPGADMRPAYLRLHKELTDRKFNVVPPIAEDIPVRLAAKYIDAALDGAVASVHLVGKSLGRILETQESIVPLQLAQTEKAIVARLNDATSDCSPPLRFIWTPKGFEDLDGNFIERDPIEAFKAIGNLLDDDLIEGGDLESFVVSVAQRLRKIPRTSKKDPVISANEKVYLCHPEADTLYAVKIAGVLKQGNIKYMMPAYFHTEDAEQREIHRKRLAECSSVMMCWANASEAWATSHSNELEDWQALGRTREFTTRTLIAGPPPHIRKDSELLRHLFPQTEIDVVLNWTDLEQPSFEAIARIFGTEASPSR